MVGNIFPYRKRCTVTPNGGAPDSTLEQLCKIFLKDFHEYTTYDDNQLKLPEWDEFNDTTSLSSQILKYQQFKNSNINAVNLRIGDLLSKFVFQSIQTSRKLIASVKDQVNIIISLITVVVALAVLV